MKNAVQKKLKSKGDGQMNHSNLGNIYKERVGKTMRESSYDTTGGNMDFLRILPGETREIFNVSEHAGCITHIWVTMAGARGLEDKEACLPRSVVIKMYWDHEDTPSVQAPIGDFFGMGHGMTKTFWSTPLNMSPQDGKGFNCYFPMPFGEAAKIEIVNEEKSAIHFFYYVDYEKYEKQIDSNLRFHSRWNRMINKGIEHKDEEHSFYQFGGKNTTGKDNYVILEAKGKGHYVGCNMNYHNLLPTRHHNWYGEGDDMIFIDGESWPPRLHGTGSEDFFNTAWCPTQEYSSPYHGIIMGGDNNWSGKSTYYRYHIQDPIMFDKSIKVTIECGHNNHRSDDYSSTAYWYQTEPHMEYEPLPKMEDRLPIKTMPDHQLEDLIKMLGKDEAYQEKFKDIFSDFEHLFEEK